MPQRVEDFLHHNRSELKAFNVYKNGSGSFKVHINSDYVGAERSKIKDLMPNGKPLPYKKCPYCKPVDNFIPFDTRKEMESFEKLYSFSFQRCRNCFPPDMCGN